MYNSARIVHASKRASDWTIEESLPALHVVPRRVTTATQPNQILRRLIVRIVILVMPVAATSTAFHAWPARLLALIPFPGAPLRQL